MKSKITLLLLAALLIFLAGCRDENTGKFNLFTVEDDRTLGAQLAQQIAENPQEFPVLDETLYPEAYAFINSLRDSVLNSGEVFYKDAFDWQVKIIRDDSTLNAFAAPGGYIYFYTGLMKYLDTEDQLVGVMGHEIAHADRRHSTNQLSKAYGISALVSVVLGNNPGLLAQIATGLLSLSFSRNDETDADNYSVIYLCNTAYNAAGAAGFFEKLEDENLVNPPQFLSTHPNPGNRVANINDKRIELGCQGEGTFAARYQQFLNSLP